MKYLILQHGGDIIDPQLDAPSVVYDDESKSVIYFNSTVPSNEIWYKSIDGNIVNLYMEMEDNPLVSNGLKYGRLVMVFLNDLTEIGGEAFHFNKNLLSITIPDSVETIGWRAFQECSNLLAVNFINPTVNIISDYVFLGCTNLTSIDIPNSVTDIGSAAFNGCSNLSSVTIGNSVLNIGNTAFDSCTSLTSITIPESITNIGEWAFRNCANLKTIKFNAINCTKFGYFDSPSFPSTVETLIIGDNVKHIPEKAFYNCSNIQDLIIGKKVNFIGEEAFYSAKNLVYNAVNCTTCGDVSLPALIDTLTIGEGVTNLPNNAFKNIGSLLHLICHKLLTSLDISGNNDDIDVEDIQNIVDEWLKGASITFNEDTALRLKGLLVLGNRAYWDGNTLKYGQSGGGYYY